MRNVQPQLFSYTWWSSLLLTLLLVVVMVHALVDTPTSTSSSSTHALSGQIVDVENALLEQLGFKERPSPSLDPKATHLPQHVRDIYDFTMGLNDVRSHAAFPGDTIRTFRPLDDLHKNVTIGSFGNRHTIPSFIFDISTMYKESEEMLHGVELRLHSTMLGGATGAKVVHLYDVYDDKVVRLLETRRLREPVARDDWLIFKVGRSLQEARHNRKHRRIRFAVNVLSDETRGKRSTSHYVSTASIPEQPTLTTYAETKMAYAKRRRKRSTTSKKSKNRRGRRKRQGKKRRNGHNKCRRHPLYVSFADVGWKDWIMAPVGYDAFYCAGRCRGFLADHMNATNHAIVRSLVHSVRIDTPVLEPCCVPTVLEPLTLLYTEKDKRTDQSNSVLKVYDDMIVKSCGCR